MSEKHKSRSKVEPNAVEMKIDADNSQDADSAKAMEVKTEEKSATKSTKESDYKAEKETAAKLEAAQKEAGDNYDRFLRVSAEFENYKKRKEREAADFRKYAHEALVKDLLPVVDNLERAIKISADHESAVSCIVEGVDMTLKEILKVLEKFAVKVVDAVGNPFDPTYHQAVLQEESTEHPENTVIKELQKGYTIHDRLLRPAMVVVAKAAPE